MAEIDSRVANVPRPAAARSNTMLLGAAVGIAIFAVVLTNIYITMVRQQVEDQGIVVYKLLRNVEPGYSLRSKDIEEVRIPSKFEEYASGWMKAADMDNYVDVPKLRILRSARQGDPVTLDLWQEESTQLDYKITPGKRGCPLPISSRTAPGILRPGMYIDLYATFPMPGQVPKTLPVMEYVKVVAVGSVTEDTNTDRRISYSTVTVEVEPADAQALLTISKFIGSEGFDPLVRQPKDNQPTFLGINPEVKQLAGLEQ